MKFCIIQPYYADNEQDGVKSFNFLMDCLDKCDKDIDVIVTPESSEINFSTASHEVFIKTVKKYGPILREKIIATAKRCGAVIFSNMYDFTDTGIRNTTFVFDKTGKEIGKYYKEHPAPSEVRSSKDGGYGLDVSYSYSYHKPYTITIDGVKYAFLTCYDFYQYEEFPKIAKEHPDVIIGCSHQRTDTHLALEFIDQFLCYNTNAYLVRASVSMGENSEVGGSSMVVAPNGEILLNLKNRITMETCEIDVTKKFYKSAGFKGVKKAHFEYIEDGRRPWLYRNSGSSMLPSSDKLPFPRICAHRGFCDLVPENTILSIGSAIALNAVEVEFDVWWTKDNELVVIHDNNLERVSDGKGFVYDYTYKELLQFNFGGDFKALQGLRITKFEDVLKKYANQAIMNIHLKTLDVKTPYDEKLLRKFLGLIEEYDCSEHVYLMIRNDTVIKQVKEISPHIAICVGYSDQYPIDQVERAIRLGAQRIQLYKPYFNEEMIERAHKNGIICNIFYADDVEEAKKYLDMGIDCILTNNYLIISKILEEKDK